MPPPHLTFFCELEPEPLLTIITDKIIADLRALHASLSLGLLDLSPERAEAVRRLNRAQIPVTAWLLLPKSQGYWFNSENAVQAAESYATFKHWSEREGLHWEAVGLDFEPDIHEMELFGKQTWSLMPAILKRVFNRKHLSEAQKRYQQLVNQIRSDGYRVESYMFPMIADERQVGSSLLRRIAGVVDILTDREVWMLYTSGARQLGAGILASYGPEAQSVAVGITGGGVENEFSLAPPLDWNELSRDLRLAWHWCDEIYIFSLEGCVRQGFLPRLKELSWDQPILLPDASTDKVNALRGSLQSALWFSANLGRLLLGGVILFLLIRRIRRFFKKRKMAA